MLRGAALKLRASCLASRWNMEWYSPSMLCFCFYLLGLLSRPRRRDLQREWITDTRQKGFVDNVLLSFVFDSFILESDRLPREGIYLLLLLFLFSGSAIETVGKLYI